MHSGITSNCKTVLFVTLSSSVRRDTRYKGRRQLCMDSSISVAEPAWACCQSHCMQLCTWEKDSSSEVPLCRSQSICFCVGLRYCDLSALPFVCDPIWFVNGVSFRNWDGVRVFNTAATFWRLNNHNVSGIDRLNTDTFLVTELRREVCMNRFAITATCKFSKQITKSLMMVAYIIGSSMFNIT
jgi:hypothetical protein